MNWLKLGIILLIGGIIVGGIIGLGYLLVFFFVMIFNSFYSLMASKSDSLLAVVAMILTCYIFFTISKNTTIKNYIQEKTGKWEENKDQEE